MLAPTAATESHEVPLTATQAGYAPPRPGMYAPPPGAYAAPPPGYGRGVPPQRGMGTGTAIAAGAIGAVGGLLVADAVMDAFDGGGGDFFDFN